MSDLAIGTNVLSKDGGRGTFQGYSAFRPDSGARWAIVDWRNGEGGIEETRLIAMPPWLVDLMRWYDNRAGHGTVSLLRAATSALEPAASAEFVRTATELIRQCRQKRHH